MTKESLHRLKSMHLGNERSIWIRPPREPAERAELVVFLDAELYRDRIGAPAILDELNASSAIANALVVFVSSADVDARWRECPCHPPFARFIIDELLPWLAARHPTVQSASTRVLVGVSYTGLAAAYVALEAGGAFNKVIAQSGSFWSDDCSLVEQYRRLPETLRVDFHLDVGCRETATPVRHKPDLIQTIPQIDAIRSFRDVLVARGYRVRYEEFDGGHDAAGWKQVLPGALRWALPA